MTIQLVFIRHGIAEDSSSNQSDFSRHLTKKGKQKLERTLPQILPLLNEDKELQIWSSPLVRARETAEIAAEIFKAEQVVTYDFISEGYFKEFWSAVERLSPSVDHTIIVVGHEPHMGYWSETLCGAFLPFKKGAAASFVHNKGGEETAELQWFFQPELMELQKITKRKT